MAGKAIANWQAFEGELENREREIAALLPRHVSKERFMSSAVAAVKQNPKLLDCDPRTLFSAITKSAQDGLLPDGREGVITPYNEKQKDNSWKVVGQWNPMTFGLRKRAKELDSLLVNAQVVHQNDEFSWDEGDNPRIIHKPADLGTARGPMIGAYAIFKANDAILHREVMDGPAIELVRKQSKQPNGLLWGTFTSEAWRKTVVRRGFKSVPCSEPLQSVVQRDDADFAFSGDWPTDQPQPGVPTPVIEPGRPLPPVVASGKAAEEPPKSTKRKRRTKAEMEAAKADEAGSEPSPAPPEAASEPATEAQEPEAASQPEHPQEPQAAEPATAEDRNRELEGSASEIFAEFTYQEHKIPCPTAAYLVEQWYDAFNTAPTKEEVRAIWDANRRLLPDIGKALGDDVAQELYQRFMKVQAEKPAEA